MNIHFAVSMIFKIVVHVADGSIHTFPSWSSFINQKIEMAQRKSGVNIQKWSN